MASSRRGPGFLRFATIASRDPRAMIATLKTFARGGHARAPETHAPDRVRGRQGVEPVQSWRRVIARRIHRAAHDQSGAELRDAFHHVQFRPVRASATLM